MAGRAGGFAATCTAPPPMMAPPQAQALSLAMAIFTDMDSPCSCAGRDGERTRSKTADLPVGLQRQMPEIESVSSALTTSMTQFGPPRTWADTCVPIVDTHERQWNFSEAFLDFRKWLTGSRSVPAGRRVGLAGAHFQPRRPFDGAKMSRPPAKMRVNFERLLSDLSCPSDTRIGAVGQSPNEPQK